MRNDSSRDGAPSPFRFMERRGRARPYSNRDDDWATDGRTNPDRPPLTESDPEAIEATIREHAKRIATATAEGRSGPLPRDPRTGRLVAGSGPATHRGHAERAVLAYLTAEAWGLTLRQLADALGISCRGVACRRRRAGERIVLAARRGATGGA